MLLAPALLLTSNVLCIYWLYRTVQFNNNLKGPGQALTPGLAVILLFVPGVNIAWFIYMAFAVPLGIKQGARTAGLRSQMGGVAALLVALALVASFVMAGLSFYSWIWLVYCELTLMLALAYMQTYVRAIAQELEMLRDYNIEDEDRFDAALARHAPDTRVQA